jgi:hypothetical protein
LGAQQEDVRARMADVAQSIAGLPAEGPPALFPETRVWSPDAVSYRTAAASALEAAMSAFGVARMNRRQSRGHANAANDPSLV